MTLFEISQINYLIGYLQGISEGGTSQQLSDLVEKPISILQDLVKEKPAHEK